MPGTGRVTGTEERMGAMDDVTVTTDGGAAPPPGVCLPFEVKLEELGGVVGDEALVRAPWEELDTAAYLYLWFWLPR